MAWVNATPQVEGGSQKGANKSRRESFAEAGQDVDYPECAADYLARYLFEIGPTLVAGMSDGPITFSEVQAWQVGTGVDLSSWESITLRRLSLDYLSQSVKSKAPGCQAPFSSEKMQASIRRVAESKFRSFIGNSRVKRE